MASLLAIWLGACAGWVVADEHPAPLRVLILFDEGPGLIALDMVEEGFVRTLRAEVGRPVELHIEYLDASRFQDSEHHALFVDYLKAKYGPVGLDLAVPVIATKSDWAARVPREIFPGVPIVFGACLLNGEHSVPLASETTGAIFSIDVVRSLETALAVKPDTQRVVVVAGPEGMHASFISRLVAASTRHAGVAFEYWTDRTGPQLLRDAAALPPDSLILYLEVFRDAAGASYIPYQFGQSLAAVASAPVFGIFESYVGTGMVGGEVIGLTRMGRNLAEIALRVVHGESVAAIPVNTDPAMVPIFDWRAMKRWGLDTADLPAESRVRFRPPSLWDAHRTLLLAGCVWSIALMLLVGGLLAQQTRRRRAERSLVENEALLRAQLTNSPDAVMIVDRDRRILLANRIAAGRYAAEQVVGMDCLQALSPGDREPARARIEECLRTGVNQEWEHSPGDGTWWQDRSVRIGNGEGRDRVMILSTDITERRRMDRYRDMARDVLLILGEQGSAPELMQRVVSVLKTSTDCDAAGIRLRDHQDLPTLCHDGFPEAFLASEDALLGRSRADGLPDEPDEPALTCACGLVLAGRTDPANPLFTRGGSAWTNDAPRDLHLSGTEDARTPPDHLCIHREYASAAFVPIRGKGKIIGLLQLVSHQKGCFALSSIKILESLAASIGESLLRGRAEVETARSRTELAHLSRISTFSELTTSLAHELNQPLAAILSNAQAGLRFLRHDDPNLAEVEAILSDIAADDKRAGEIIHRMRDFLRNEPPRRDWVDLRGVVDEVLTILHSEAVIQGISVETDSDGDRSRVRGDRVQLQQVLINLIVNAGQALSEAGSNDSTVLIRTFRDDDGSAGLTVQDNGPGIPESKLETVFDPFYSRKAEGMGMGLAISRSIVQAHGGRIWAENGPQGGARFCLRFPVETPP